MSEAVEAGPPAHLVLVHDGAGVPMGEPVLIRQPVRTLFAAQERGARFEALEPLREGSSGDGRDARDQVLMRLRGVVQSQLAPPGGGPVSVETASRQRSWQPPKCQLPLTFLSGQLPADVYSPLGQLNADVRSSFRTAARRSWPYPGRRPRTSFAGQTSCRGTGGCSPTWR